MSMSEKEMNYNTECMDFLTEKGTNEENAQRHIDDRGSDVDKPVGKEWGYPQENDVIDQMFSMFFNLQNVKHMMLFH